MTNNLYFIPMLARALAHSDPKTALQAAFSKITQQGLQARSRRGFRQFQRFMQEVGRSNRQENYRAIREEMEKVFPPKEYPDILVKRDDHMIGKICLPSDSSQTNSLTDLVAGHYSLSLETGRVIWDGELEDKDLIWSAAFPGRPVKLAAETAQSQEPPTRILVLLEGELVVKVFAGLETGRIEIEFHASEKGDHDG